MRLIILFFVLVFSIQSCQRDSKTDNDDGGTPVYKEGAEKFVLVDTKENKKNWVLRAERADSYDDSIIIYEVSVEFFDKEGEYYSTLTSDSGIVYSKSGDMTAKGHVVVVSEDSTVLKTDYLDWNNKRQKILTDDRVEITKENSIITGKGMESDPNLEHIEIKEEFQAISRDVKEE